MTTPSAERRMALRPVWSLALLMANAGVLFAQAMWTPQQYTLENGLPQTSVVSLAMDANGYLWFTTEGGPVRSGWGDRFEDMPLPFLEVSTRDLEREMIPVFDGSFLVTNSTGGRYSWRT
jgi:ligand-binding sensor domain-containing protein